VRVVVLSGAGRGFCAGLDIIECNSGGDSSGIERLSEIVLTIKRMPQIVVASVHGAAVGGGFAFAHAADLRIVGESAKFKNGFIDIGVSPTAARLVAEPNLETVIASELAVQLECMQHPDFAEALGRFGQRRR
jgi:enoyl-CoA hydratase/carnithine racemase